MEAPEVTEAGELKRVSVARAAHELVDPSVEKSHLSAGTKLASVVLSPMNRSTASATLLLLAACSGGTVEPRRDAEADAGSDAREDDGSFVDAGPDARGDAGPTCEGTESGSQALHFDGEDDTVSMGIAPELGLAEFTLEAWIYRDGPGLTSGTGSGGVTVVPIIAKGRGEHDGSNVDCNYAFGLYGDVLAADFEDMASGANHPVIGRTAVGREEWHHVAVTYDGTTWRLYVDGALDVEKRVDATPRADSIQHFGIGTTYDSEGAPRGHFAGAIDEVRVFDRARTRDELIATRDVPLETADGLVGRWSLDAPDATVDSTGRNAGTIEGATEIDGATLGFGTSPMGALRAPADDAEVTGASVELSLDIDGATPLEVDVFARQITEEDDFTIVVLPDTQIYTLASRDLEPFYYAQTQWAVDNAEAYNIVGVIHNGDIVNNADVRSQWVVADRAMTTLEEATDFFVDGLPYGLSVGNHDQFPRKEPGETSFYNQWFGVDRFAGRFYYGGHMSSKNDQSWVTFQAGGREILVVNLEYDETQDTAVLAWAREVFETHPDALGILNSHYIVNGAGNYSAQGRAIYNALRDVPNLFLMTSGHVTAERRIRSEFEGHVIHSMVADYQGRDQGGGGMMRIWEFSPSNDELTVRSYSPRLDRWETDGNSQFTLPLDLSTTSSVGATFDLVGRVERATTEASAELTGLVPGGVYEWYAEISDCHHVVRTPVSRFHVAP